MKAYVIQDISELAVMAIRHHGDKKCVQAYKDAATEQDRIYTEICEKVLSGEYIGAKLTDGKSFRTITKSIYYENKVQETYWMICKDGEIIPLSHHDVIPGNVGTYEYCSGIYEIEED